MFKINRGSNSFKLGVIAGMSFFIALQNLVGMVSAEDFQIARLLLLVSFGVVGIACTLKAYKKI